MFGPSSHAQYRRAREETDVFLEEVSEVELAGGFDRQGSAEPLVPDSNGSAQPVTGNDSYESWLGGARAKYAAYDDSL